MAAMKSDTKLLDNFFEVSRFRGVYLRIADNWPEEDAKIVRDRFVEYAADKNDNITSNEFIRRLKLRQATKANGIELNS